MPQNVGSIVANVVDCSRLQQQHQILQQDIENRFNNISLVLEGKPPNWTVNGSEWKISRGELGRQPALQLALGLVTPPKGVP